MSSLVFKCALLFVSARSLGLHHHSNKRYLRIVNHSKKRCFATGRYVMFFCRGKVTGTHGVQRVLKNRLIRQLHLQFVGGCHSTP